MDELESGTAVETESAASATAQETTPGETSATQAAEAEGAAEQDTFLSDAELLAQIRQDPKLNKFYGKMQGAYGKSREELKRGREAAAQIQQFYNDPAYRRQVLSQYAHEIQAQAKTENGSQGQGVKAPAELVTRIEASLAPELKWMAPQLADANWAAQQATVAPILQAREQEKRQSLSEAYDDASAEMNTKYPGWEEHETEMNGVLQWLQGGGMTHKKYGNRIEALYKLMHLLNGNSGPVRAEAIRATSEAARSRTVTGQSGRAATENHTEKIRTAKTHKDAFALAAQLAEEQMRRDGAALG